MSLRHTANLSESLNHKLSSYALAATAAGVGTLALVQPSEAKIVYTPAHKHIGPHQKFLLDLNHDGKSDFKFVNATTCGTDICLTWLAVTQAGTDNGIVGFKDGVMQWASVLKKGTRVPSSDHFYGKADMVYMDYGNLWGGSSWANVKNRYLGLKFKIHGQTHYAWARLSVKVTNHGTFGSIMGTITGYAYETTPNKPIITGKTKGPDVITVKNSSLGHLARGASAIPAWRGKNSAK